MDLMPHEGEIKTPKDVPKMSAEKWIEQIQKQLTYLIANDHIVHGQLEELINKIENEKRHYPNPEVQSHITVKLLPTIQFLYERSHPNAQDKTIMLPENIKVTGSKAHFLNEINGTHLWRLIRKAHSKRKITQELRDAIEKLNKKRQKVGLKPVRIETYFSHPQLRDNFVIYAPGTTKNPNAHETIQIASAESLLKKSEESVFAMIHDFKEQKVYFGNFEITPFWDVVNFKKKGPISANCLQCHSTLQPERLYSINQIYKENEHNDAEAHEKQKRLDYLNDEFSNYPVEFQAFAAEPIPQGFPSIGAPCSQCHNDAFKPKLYPPFEIETTREGIRGAIMSQKMPPDSHLSSTERENLFNDIKKDYAKRLAEWLNNTQ